MVYSAAARVVYYYSALDTFVCLDGHLSLREFASDDSGRLWRFMHHGTVLDHRDDVVAFEPAGI